MQYEYRTEQVQLKDARKGDILLAVDDKIVETVKKGTKWVELRGADGKLIVRGLAEETEQVRRRYETEESKKARRREAANESIQKDLDRWSPTTPAELSKISEDVEEYGQTQDYRIASLIKAQASDQLWSEWKEFHAWLTPEGTDSVGAMKRFAERKTQELLRRSRGLSRSTSVVANAAEDAYTAELAQFIEESQWY